eukprot:gene8398-11207_t
MELPETLDFKLHAWRQTGSLNMYGEEGFEASSWLAIHAGMGNWPVRADPVLAEVPRAEALLALHQRRDHFAAVVATMPTHEAFLRHITDPQLGPCTLIGAEIISQRALTHWAAVPIERDTHRGEFRPDMVTLDELTEFVQFAARDIMDVGVA